MPSTAPNCQRVEKPWGYELILTPPEAKAVGKILHVSAGFKLSYQYHDQKEETLVLLSGQAKIILDDQEIIMEPQKGYFIPPFFKHRIIAVTDCDLMESSTPETGNTFRLSDDYQRPTETETLRNTPNRGWTSNDPQK